MALFVFEAIVHGVIGGAVGVVVGVLLALGRGLFEFGTLFLVGLGAPGPLLVGVLLSFGIGVVLAALAAVGPAFIAARLPPMEAMRVD
jgi:ABC-type antimicrobial peptide transport system permease subunit